MDYESMGDWTLAATLMDRAVKAQDADLRELLRVASVRIAENDIIRRAKMEEDDGK